MPEQVFEDEQHLKLRQSNNEAKASSAKPKDTLDPGTPLIRGSRRAESYVEEARHPDDNETSLMIPSHSFEALGVDPFAQQNTAQFVVSELKKHIDVSIAELKSQKKKDHELILSAMQQESAKRTALEQRLYSHLISQSETMVAMELKLLRLEAELERREFAAGNSPSSSPANPQGFQTILEGDGEALDSATNTEFISSANSLASAVTAESFNGDGDGNGRRISDRSNDASDVDSQRSTPTFGSRTNNPIAGGNLESILLNPMLSENYTMAYSMRATRGDLDGNSSLGTTVTGSTLTSTIATRTDLSRLDSSRADSIRGRYLALDPESRRTTSALTVDSQEASFEMRPPRSRSNSPVANQSYTTDVPSVGSGASQSTAIMSSVAVAAPRARRALRGETAPDSRPLANRVVSFTTDIVQSSHDAANNENCDSITMPDELDNLSEVVDAFAASARNWREEYEARLEALQKRMVNE